MPKYKLSGDYGTFRIQRVVEAADEDAAFTQTGIGTALEAAGWTMIEWPEGETWTIDEVGPRGRRRPQRRPHDELVSEPDAEPDTNDSWIISDQTT